jgi:dolichyl-phosphate beta-glucosyltransferase
MPTPYISVVIPSYNERKNIARGVLDEVVQYLKSQPNSWEVILTDDGSTDGTAKELDEFAAKHTGVKVLHNKHAGKGPTVQSGMLAAKGEWRLFTDFDQSTPLSEIEKLLAYASTHDVIIGSRELQGAKRDEEPWYRHLMGRVFNGLVQTLAVPGIQDTQCGFKLFSAKASERLFPALFIYGRKSAVAGAFTGAFDVELLFLANKWKFPIKEVPILWKHFETDRVSAIRDSVRMFRDIIRIRLAEWRGAYASSSAE